MIYVPVFVTMFDNEKFYEIPYKDISDYAISESGRVISKKSGTARTTPEWKEKSLTKHKQGYLLVTLTTDTPGRKFTIYKSNIQKTYTLHKLLYSTFKSGIEHVRDEVVDHIDNNVHNNAVSNLTLLDRYDNLYKHRTNKPEHIIYSVKVKPGIDKAKISRVNMWTERFERILDNQIGRIREGIAIKEARELSNTLVHIERYRQEYERGLDKSFRWIRLDIDDLDIEVGPIDDSGIRPMDFANSNPDYMKFTEACRTYAAKKDVSDKRAKWLLLNGIRTNTIPYTQIGKRYFIHKSAL